MDPIRIAQIAGGFKGCGLDYAHKIITASGGGLVLQDFIDSPTPHPDDGLPAERRGEREAA